MEQIQILLSYFHGYHWEVTNSVAWLANQEVEIPIFQVVLCTAQIGLRSTPILVLYCPGCTVPSRDSYGATWIISPNYLPSLHWISIDPYFPESPYPMLTLLLDMPLFILMAQQWWVYCYGMVWAHTILARDRYGPDPQYLKPRNAEPCWTGHFGVYRTGPVAGWHSSAI